MIENTLIEELINRCFDGWGKRLDVFDPHDRERESDGTFKADDQSTPEVNEAWKSGKSPKKKVRRKKKKSES